MASHLSFLLVDNLFPSFLHLLEIREVSMDPAISALTNLRDPMVLDSSTSNHFLSLPRPDVTNGPLLAGVPDTSTLAAHDFDVDTRTGFMPPDPPLERLPVEWELWEQLLRGAIEHRLQLGSKPYLSEEERAKSYAWRESVNLVCCLISCTSELLFLV